MSNLSTNNHPTLNEQLEKEFIKAIANNLKIELDIFTVKAIKELTSFLSSDDYTKFLLELMKANHNYKKPLQVLAEVSDNWKKNKINSFCDDVQEKAIKLVIKVNKTFSDLQKIGWQLNQSPTVLIARNNLEFSSFTDKNKNRYFTDKEIKALLEVETFERWHYFFENGGLDNLEDKLTLSMRTARTKFYLGAKESNSLELENKVSQKINLLTKGA